ARICPREGRPLEAGSVLRQPDLARTLERLAAGGAEEFYHGETAERIAAALAPHGALITRRDLAEHTADWSDPISVRYRGYTALNCPPNTQGMASLEILNILENFDLSAIPEGSADYCHLLVEATREAFLDRDAYLTDPDFADIPLAELLSPAHGARQAARIDMGRAGSFPNPLDPRGDTVWLGTADAEGNAVSLIQSVYFAFGSGVVPPGTGIILQNRGTFFSLDPASPNVLMPRKRSFHTLNPAMLLKDGRPYLVYGTMGGEGQPQTQAALVTRIIDYGMSPQDAIAAPRWLWGRSWGADANGLRLESRFGDDVFRGLAARGHDVSRVAAYDGLMGHAGAILINGGTGVMYGGCDPRSDGLAAGL
ncbi:MAG: gamma-glutamyltransferase family protein, partial [Mailhella sp.]|nr:gamma-glutamyltransferase family protein [Mailhella sp.]